MSTVGDAAKKLGKCAIAAAERLRRLGWVPFIKQMQYPSELASHLKTIPHAAGPYLHRLNVTGVPAPSSATPWPEKTRRHVLTRGPHVSAARLYRSFLMEDMLDMVHRKFWVVLPYKAVRRYTHLNLAPSGVVPQRERRPRPIMDYTFTGVNQHSLPLAPDSMQIGNTLQRVLQRLAYADPSYGPPQMLKLDLDDGYYRVHLSPEAALELAVVLPGPKPTDTLIGVPLSLPMGWALSPPYFCAFTETAADLANRAIAADASLPQPHALMEMPQQSLDPVPVAAQFSSMAVHPPSKSMTDPLSYVDIYIDDFLAIAQRPRLQSTLAHTLNGIFRVFRDSPHTVDTPTRKHVVSQSKLLKGDGAWSTAKILLGWLIDTEHMTISLPAHKAARLRQILAEFGQKTRTSRRQWQKLLGELRHMSTAIRGAKYLFSMLQHVLIDQRKQRIRLHPNIKATLNDWSEMAHSMSTHPVPIAALIPKAPSYVGAVDASGEGCGGIWLATHFGCLQQPLVFRWPFPTSVSSLLVSTTNKTGTLSNSDFELAAIIAGTAVLQANANTTAATLYIASDNTPAVSWCTKGSTSSIGANAHLLRYLAQLSRSDNCSLQVVSVPGSSNTIADFCSRAFHLNDQDFLRELNKRFPVTPPWQLAPITANLASRLTSSLLRVPSHWGSAIPDGQPPTTHLPSGKPSAKNIILTPPWASTPTQSRSSKCLGIDTDKATLLPIKLRYAVERWATPFVPWGRRWPSWDTPTPDLHQPENWTSVCHANFLPTRKRTLRQPESSPSPSTYYSKPPQWPACLPTHCNRPSLTC